ncbi:hypothetical protein O181_101353, partial [Austropuccinia psidii MF-1]|nr:hypothetical protein [Austropuccinia psidii MF-1]
MIGKNYTRPPPVCTHTHQRGPSASLDVGGGFDFTRSSMKCVFACACAGACALACA